MIIMIIMKIFCIYEKKGSAHNDSSQYCIVFVVCVLCVGVFMSIKWRPNGVNLDVCVCVYVFNKHCNERMKKKDNRKRTGA
mgnify:CR=1 FL=1